MSCHNEPIKRKCGQGNIDRKLLISEILENLQLIFKNHNYDEDNDIKDNKIDSDDDDNNDNKNDDNDNNDDDDDDDNEDGNYNYTVYLCQYYDPKINFFAKPKITL